MKIKTDMSNEKYRRILDKLMTKYSLTKAQVIEFAAKNPKATFYTPEGLLAIFIGIIKAGMKEKKTMKLKTKKVCLKPKVKGEQK